MRRFNMIHLCAGGEPRRMIGRDDPQITATYWDGLNVVGTETVATWLGMALCDPWFKGDEAPSHGEKTVRVMADWDVDFGRARVLEGRMRKALEQMP